MTELHGVHDDKPQKPVTDDDLDKEQAGVPPGDDDDDEQPDDVQAIEVPVL
jgi:hypothetical protein